MVKNQGKLGEVGAPSTGAMTARGRLSWRAGWPPSPPGRFKSPAMTLSCAAVSVEPQTLLAQTCFAVSASF